MPCRCGHPSGASHPSRRGPGGKKPAQYEPASSGVTVQAGWPIKSSFILRGGLAAALTPSDPKVKADGLTVVSGEIETTQYGRPKGSL